MSTIKHATNPEVTQALADLSQQITVLGLALCCSLKATALRNPDVADSIERNLRDLMASHDPETWQPRAKGLLDLMYTALSERSDDEQR